MLALSLSLAVVFSAASSVRAACNTGTNCPAPIPGSSFKPVGCFTNSNPQGLTPIKVLAGGGYAQCAPLCRNSAGFFYIDFNNQPGDDAYCHCSPRGTIGVGEASCNYIYALEFFQHDVNAQASGLARRAARDALSLSPRRLCSKGKEACLIQPGLDAFECLDTTQELDSCGGCRFGSADAPSNATVSRFQLQGRFEKKEAPVGIDCTNLPGVSISGVSCASSKCSVFKCKLGWKLEDGSCVQDASSSSKGSRGAR